MNYITIHQIFSILLKIMGLKSFYKICQNFKFDHVKCYQIDIILYEHFNSGADKFFVFGYNLNDMYS